MITLSVNKYQIGYPRPISEIVSCCDKWCAALRAVLNPENMSSSSQAKQTSVRLRLCVHCTLRLCVHFKYAFFHRRLQLFQSLFGSLFSIAVWIYFNRLLSTGAKLFCIWNFIPLIVVPRDKISAPIRRTLPPSHFRFRSRVAFASNHS